MDCAKNMRIILLLLFLAMNVSIFCQTDLVPLGDRDKPILIYPTQIVEGPDSNIYVYDEKDSYIKVFSPKGEFIQSFAGAGEGPGYIKRQDAVNFGFTPSRCIYISEYFGGHRWISIMKKDGSFQDVINPGISNSMYGVERIFSLKNGSYLIEFSFIGLPKKQGNFFLHSSPQTIYHMDSKGNLLAKIKETDFFKRISYYTRGADLAIPFSAGSIWTPYKEDNILFIDRMDNIFLVLDFKGKTVGHIDTELPKVPLITKQDLTNWCQSVKNQMDLTQSGKEWYKKFGKVIEEYKYKSLVYKKKPYIQALAVTPEGNFFVSSTTGPGSRERKFWLLNQKGKIIVFSNSNILEIQLSLHYIFLKKRDDDENIMVYYIKRKNDEKSDLKRFFQSMGTVKWDRKEDRPDKQ